MSEIVKTIDERERQKKKKKTERRKGASYSEIGFVQLICKASIIFESNFANIARTTTSTSEFIY